MATCGCERSHCQPEIPEVMGIFPIALLLATLLCSLVAGVLFIFAVVVMPGIRNLEDRAFIRTFQVMDRVIQNNHPMFLLVWVGSVVALVISTLLGLGRLDGLERLLLILAALAYLVGVQLPTATINIPLNNRLQAVEVDAIDEAEREAARKSFEPRWNR